MKYRLIAGRDLDESLTEAWQRIRRSDPAWSSPYFDPGFTRVMASVRDDVFVGLIEDATGTPVGFFPFHRLAGGRGRPIGLGLSDYHGLVCMPGVDWDVRPLLTACRLVRFDFDHLVNHRSAFDAGVASWAPSPIVFVTSTGRARCAAHDS